MDFVYLPLPDEEKLTALVTRSVEFPNGRIAKLTLSIWHWEMIDFYDLFSTDFGREQGILYEWYKLVPNRTDSHMAKAIMSHIRDDFNEWAKIFPPGEEFKIPGPKKTNPK